MLLLPGCAAVTHRFRGADAGDPGVAQEALRTVRGLLAGVARSRGLRSAGGTDAGLHHVGGKMGTSEGRSVLVDPEAPSVVFSAGTHGTRLRIGVELTP